MATKPYRKNAWSFRPNVVFNPSATSFDPQNPASFPSPSPSLSNLASLSSLSSFPLSSQQNASNRSSPVKPSRHIYQRIEENKEEHALQFYSKACKDNLQVKEKVKVQCKKSEAGLLMENSHLYRSRVENSKILRKAKGIEDCHSGEKMWTMSLRDHWSYEPRIGDLYAARVDCSKEMTAEIEQIGSPVKPNLYDLLQGVSASKKREETSSLTAYNHFLKKCKKRFSKVGIYRPEFLGFQVIGTKLDLDIAKSVEQNIQQKESVENAQHKESEESTGGKESELVNTFETGVYAEGLKTSLYPYRVRGPAAELDNSKLFLSGKPGELLNSKVTLQNKGSTILYYKWLQQPSGSVFEAVRRGRGEYFEIMPRAGYVEPGETEVFYISFYPRHAGVFTQSWFLEFSPNLLTPLNPVKLLGIAVEEFGNSAQRKLLAHSLEVKQRNSGLEEVFSKMIEDAVKWAPLTFSKKTPGFVLSAENFAFLRSNECYETPLYYNPRLVQEYEKLTLMIASCHNDTSNMEPNTNTESDKTNDPTIGACNLSISSPILSVHDGQCREEHQKKLGRLLDMMALPPHPSSILYTVMYKSIGKMINRMEKVLEQRKMLEEAERVAGIEENVDDNESSEKDGLSDYEEGSDDASDPVGSKMQKRAKQDVKKLLQEMVEHFFSGTEDAVRRIEPLIQEMIQSSMAKADTGSATWIDFWFQRLLHSLAQ